MMGAYMNALREEGTKADLLRELESKMDEIERLRADMKAAKDAAVYLCAAGVSPKLRAEAEAKLMAVFSEKRDGDANG
jgi:hypothetical protein